jgi:phosphoribosylformylglycinamidine (FGAM) synthase-like enzyme
VAIGGDPREASVLDNFSWGRVDKPENLGDLVEACRACYDGAMAYGAPFISGKDSLNNDYRVGDTSRSIPPTLLITALAIVPDVRATCSMDLKAPGHTLILVGETTADLGGSHLARLCGTWGRTVPPVDLEQAPRLLGAMHDLVAAGRLAACHDLSEGGLGVAAAEMAFAGGVGAHLDLAAVPARGTLDVGRRLFAESPTRFLLEVEDDQLAAVEAGLQGFSHARVGTTTDGTELVIDDGDVPVLRADLESLRSTFTAPLDLDAESGGAT